MPAPDAQRGRPFAVANFARRPRDAADGGAVESSAVPAYAHHDPAACAQAFDAALRPRARKGREQMYLARVRLQEHLRDPGGRAEVAVYLEGRVCVEEVRVDAASAAARGVFGVDGRERGAQKVVCALAVEQTRPEVYLPSEAPARARVAADFERPSGRREEVGRRARRYLRARKKSVEVRDVSVVHLRRFHVPVFEPFLQLPGLARLHRGHARAQRREFRRELTVYAESLRGADAVLEEVADDLGVHRGACADRDAAGVNVLRRERGARDHPLVYGLFDERVGEELGRALQHGVDFREVVFVGGELVVIPEVFAKPRAARRPHAPERPVYGRARAPQVRVVVADPAARAPVNARPARAVLDEFRDPAYERLLALRKGRRPGGPGGSLPVDADC